jgi:hypothetical protein
MNTKKRVLKYYNDCTRVYQLAWANKKILPYIMDSGIPTSQGILTRFQK